MPFDFLRRQFLERFFSGGNQNQNQQQQPQRPASPAPQGETLEEQERSLRPPAAPPVVVQPEWEAVLNPEANTQATEQANTPSATDLDNAEHEAPGQTTAPTAPPAPPPTLVEEVRRRGLFPEFEKMWKAHPRNNGSAESVSSRTVNSDQGWDPDQWANTCAIRVSVMLNTLGGEHKITKEKAVAAGLKSSRVFYSRKTKWYYLLAASEIAQYVAHHQGKPSVTFPKSTRYKDAQAYNADFDTKMAPAINGKKGFVFFDKIFGYSGTGHVDVFDGMTLSAASSWYPSQALKLWYV